MEWDAPVAKASKEYQKLLAYIAFLTQHRLVQQDIMAPCGMGFKF